MRFEGRSAAALLLGAVSLAFMAVTTACAPEHGEREPVVARAVPAETDVTFYAVAFHWGWDVFDDTGQKLDEIHVAEGTAVEMFAVNSQAEEAIGRLPAPVSAAVHEISYVTAPEGAGIGYNDLRTHGFMISGGYRLIEQLPPDASEPVRVAFVADIPGSFMIECVIYCGVGHNVHKKLAVLMVGDADAASTAATAPAAAPASTAPLTGAAAAGREFFTSSQCNACHPGGEQLVGPSLFGVTQRMTESQVRNQIRNGGILMPPFGTDVVSDETMDNLIAFLQTLE